MSAPHNRCLLRSPRGERGAVRVALVLVVVVLLAAAGATGAWWWTHRDKTADPATVTIPAPKAADATGKYLRGPGKVLPAFLDQTDDLSATAAKAECTALVAGPLKHAQGPQQLAATAQRIPDPTLRDAFQSHIRQVVVYLSACGNGDDLDQPAEDAHFTATVVRRQLDAVGEQR